MVEPVSAPPIPASDIQKTTQGGQLTSDKVDVAIQANIGGAV